MLCINTDQVHHPPLTLLWDKTGAVVWHEVLGHFITVPREDVATLITTLANAETQAELERQFAAHVAQSSDQRRFVPFSDRKYATYFATLNITSDCNLACQYCYARGGERKLYMDFRVARAVFDFMTQVAKSRIRFLFHGGEPLMNYPLIKEFTEFVRHSNPSDKTIHLCLQTNGTLVTDEMAAFFAVNDVGVGISVDGPDDEANQLRIARDSNMPATREALRGLDTLRRHGHSPGIIIVVTRANYRRIPEVTDFFIREGVLDITLNPLIHAGRATEGKLGISVEEYTELNRTLLQTIVARAEYRSPQIIERNLRYLVQNLVSDQRRYMCLRSPCGAATNLLGFTPNGDIYPCDDFSHVSDLRIGNIFDDDAVARAMDSAVARHFRDITVDTFTPCSDCAWRWVCGAGGCASRRFFVQGTIAVSDPLCSYFKAIIPDLLLAIARLDLQGMD